MLPLLRYLSIICAIALSPIAHSHESIGSVSTALVQVDGKQVYYFLSIPPEFIENAIPTDQTEWYRWYLSTTLEVSAWDQTCEFSSLSPFTKQTSGNQIAKLTFTCPMETTELSIRVTSFFDYDDKHMQVIRLVDLNDPKITLQEDMMSLKNPVFLIADSTKKTSVFWHRAKRFFVLGVEHILSGLDHILFILCAIVVLASLKDIIKVVTSFTVAHSITLAATFLGWISVPSAWVEPLIAFTIIYMAVSNLLRKSFKHRAYVTFLFGLIHGMGFAGALTEITFSQKELLTSLAAFNVGIEAGQLAVVLVAIALFLLIRQPVWQTRIRQATSAVVAIAGVFWLTTRLIPLASVTALIR